MLGSSVKWVHRGGSRTAAISKMELFVIIVNGFQPITIITKSSILDVAAVLETPLGADTEKGQFAFDYCHKIMMRVGVYFKQEIQSNTYHDQTKRLH